MAIVLIFHSRRAKAKLLDGKKPRHGDWSDTPPDTPPQLSAGFEADLHSLIHEDQRECSLYALHGYPVPI